MIKNQQNIISLYIYKRKIALAICKINISLIHLFVTCSEQRVQYQHRYSLHTEYVLSIIKKLNTMITM